MPDLPGCASQSDTYDEAMANIREATQSYLEAHKKLGQPVPAPRTEVKVIEVPAA
jgi:predicted RNase H-like HicB family nuclease